MIKNTIFKGYHHTGNRYEQGLEGRKRAVLSDESLTPEQRSTLEKWAKERKANSFKENNTVCYLYTLRDLGLFIKEQFEKDMDDRSTERKADKMKEYIQTHHSRYYKKLLRQFYRWLNNGDLPYCVKWLNIKEKGTERKSKPVLSDEEISLMIKACDNPRDKTLLMLLADTGCRVSEILGLRFGKDSQGRITINLTDEGGEITVKGKTGERRLTLIDSVPYLTEYINNHPWREQEGKPLFFASLHSGRYGAPLEYCGAKMIVKRACRIAGINKKISTHIFRRSLATKLGKEEKFTIGEVKAQMGWSSIRTADSYLQITSEDTGAKRKAKANGEILEQQKSEALKPKICPRCNKINPADTSFCSCGMALSRQAVSSMAERMEKLEAMLLAMAKADTRFKKAALIEREAQKKKKV